jgi:hypothetical protein
MIIMEGMCLHQWPDALIPNNQMLSIAQYIVEGDTL